MVDAASSLWAKLLERLEPTLPLLPQEPLALLVGLPLLAFILIHLPLTWRQASYFTTFVHEAGHALAALLVGSRLEGVRLRWDSSGETVQAGRRFLPFRLWITWWGYPFPLLVGVFYLWASWQGWQGMAWTFTLFLTFILFLYMRSLLAVLVITGSLAVAWALWWSATPSLMALSLHFFGVFFFLGGLRALVSLTRDHLQGRVTSSDAHALQGLTLIPSMVWLVTFWLAGILGLAALLRSFMG